MPAAAMAQHHYSFPVVTGIEPADPVAARSARMAVYGRLMSDLDSNGQHLSQQISEIDLADPEDARVLMPEQGGDILAHFGQDHFLERYQRYKAHIAEWRQQYATLAAVDLRYDQQVVLQMAGGKEASEPQPVANAAQTASEAAQPASKPSAGTHETVAKPKAEKKPAAASAANKSHADHSRAEREKKKRADQRHTALNEIESMPTALAAYQG
jgi:cell division protein FtsQ